MAISKVSSSVHFAGHAAVIGGRERTHAHWEPNTDVYLTEGGLVIKVELAGIRSENLEIVVEGSRIRISGERPDCSRTHKCKFLVMNITYGPFESILELPPGYDLTQAKAAYMNGFLRIDVPLAEKPKPKPTKLFVAEGE